MKMDWHQKHCQAMELLWNVHIKLAHLGNAFYETGNLVLAKKLQDIANTVYEAQKMASDATGESISLSLKNAQDSAKATVEAALAGIHISKE